MGIWWTRETRRGETGRQGDKERGEIESKEKPDPKKPN